MSTSKSLLQLARINPESEAWYKLVSIYDPLIAGWLSRSGVANSDIADLSQEVLCVVATELKQFEHNGKTGAFRNWLKKITVFRCRRYWETQRKTLPRDQLAGTDSNQEFLNNLEDPKSDLSALWDREHDHYVLERIFQLIKSEFDQRTLDVFTRNVLVGEPPNLISEDLGISRGNVYKLKFRVMQRLKEEAEGLIDDAPIN